MGNVEDPYRGESAMPMNFPDGAFIVAEEAYLPELSSISANMSLRLVSLDLDAELPSEVVAKATIVVLQADPANPSSMSRIHVLRSQRPYMPIIVALHNADLRTTRSLIREGVNDVVALPFQQDQLVDALIDASVGAESDHAQGRSQGQLYSVVGSTGGCGATTIATHLAAQLALHSGESSCLLDLDIQFGTAASYLGVAQQHSVRDLLDSKDRLDADLFGSVASEVGNGLKFVSAPHEILPVEEMDVDQILRVIKYARQDSEIVLVDLPLDFTNWSVSAIMDSTLVLMVVELNLTSLRHARRRIDLLTGMGISRKKIVAVTNKVEKKFFKTIDNADAEKALKVRVVGSVFRENTVLQAAQDQGLLAEAYQARNTFSRDIANLAVALALLETER